MDDRRYPDTRMQQPDNPLPYQFPVLPQAGLNDNGRPYGGSQGDMGDNAPGSGTYGWQNGWNQNTQGGWNQYEQNGWNQYEQNSWNQYAQNGWNQYGQNDWNKYVQNGWNQNGQNGQNGWNQYVQGGPFSTGSRQQSPSTNKKKYSTTFWALVITGSMLLLIILFFAGWFFLRLNGSGDKPAAWLEERTVREEQRSDFWTQEDEREKPKKPTEEYEKDTEGIYGTTPDADYYSGLTDSINTTTDYSIEWQNYSFEDPDTNSDISVIYPQIIGEEIPNLELLNENLAAYAMSVVDFYSDFYLPQAGSSDYLYASAAVFVTYNDDSTMSVVVQEEIQLQDAVHQYLCCLNVDLVNGKLVWNTDMLELDDAFLTEFRKQVALQNGWNLEFTNQELYEYLSNEDTLILFYTPVGLEVGINFVNDYGEVAWVSATIKDYYKYVKSIG